MSAKKVVAHLNTVVIIAVMVKGSVMMKKCENCNDLCFKNVKTKADYVEIVRCKNCVYANEKGDTCYFGEGRFVTPEHYCGYAERKIEDGN